MGSWLLQYNKLQILTLGVQVSGSHYVLKLNRSTAHCHEATENTREQRLQELLAISYFHRLSASPCTQGSMWTMFLLVSKQEKKRAIFASLSST